MKDTRANGARFCLQIVLMSSHCLGVGASVHVVGLQHAADLNGEVGYCKELQDSGRWVVSFRYRGEKAIRPENLRLRSIFCPGTIVCVHGLVRSTELNGRSGTCVNWNEERGRWRIGFDNGMEKSISPMNLKEWQHCHDRGPASPQRYRSRSPRRHRAAQHEEDSGSQAVGFGRHAGRSFEEVLGQDPGYCRWCLDQVNPSRLMRGFQSWLRRNVLSGHGPEASQQFRHHEQQQQEQRHQRHSTHSSSSNIFPPGHTAAQPPTAPTTTQPASSYTTPSSSSYSYSYVHQWSSASSGARRAAPQASAPSSSTTQTASGLHTGQTSSPSSATPSAAPSPSARSSSTAAASRARSSAQAATSAGNTAAGRAASESGARAWTGPPQVPGDLLSRLPRVPFNADLFSGSPYPDECPICMESWQDVQSEIVLTPCFHTFHVSCLQSWLMQCEKCPSCRWNVNHTGVEDALKSSQCAGKSHQGPPVQIEDSDAESLG